MLSGLGLGALAGLGVHLLLTPPSGRRRLRRPTDGRRLLGSVAAPAGAGLATAIATAALIGGPAAPVAGLIAAACGVLGRRSLDAARRDQARRLWPALLEEVRVLTTSGGRSLPRALLEAGRRVPEPAAGAFRAADHAWQVSADFDRATAALKHGLAEAGTDAVVETLRVAHEVGGEDVGRRLAKLAEDRRRDLATRDLAVAKLAGARFARRFVLIVPLGMAAAGQAVGTGRAAFASAAGQVVGLVSVGLVAACWLWAGNLLRLPEDARVFPR